jgi:hypothetical protein
MTIVWRSKPPSQMKQSPARCIYNALQDRDDARLAFSKSEQRLAAVVGQQPPPYWHAFNAFRAAGGCTAEQWQDWERNGGAGSDKPGLRWRYLRLVSSQPAC